MSRFHQLLTVGLPALPAPILTRLHRLSEKPPRHLDIEGIDTSALSPDLIATDALLVSLHTDVPASVMSSLPALRYIGVLGTSQGRIDLAAAKSRSIRVTSVPSYCDRETAEFAFGEILRAARGLAGPMWKAEPRSVHGRSLGILGLGKVGRELARMARGFGMEVNYHSRTRKTEAEAIALRYLSRRELLASSEIVSVHLPPHQTGFFPEDFSLLRTDALWINTSMGDVFRPDDLLHWLENSSGMAVLDSLAGRQMKGATHPRLWISERPAYWTTESLDRLYEVFIKNAADFLVES